MEFKIEASELYGLASKISSVIGNGLLEFNNKLGIKTTDAGLHLIGAGMEEVFEGDIPARVIKQGSCSVEAKRFVDLLKKLGKNEIHATGNNRLIIKSGKTKFQLPSSSYEIFPFFDDEEKFSLKTDELSGIVNRLAFAVSTDALRPALGGVYFRQGEAVATNGVQLSLYKNNLDIKNPFLVGLEPLKKVVKYSKGEVNISITERFARFFFEDMVLQTRLIGEGYVEYERVLDFSHDGYVEVDTKEMIQSLELLLGAANEINYQGEFKIDSKQIKISASDIDAGTSGEVVVPVIQSNTQDKEIFLNIKSFIELFRSIQTETATISYAPEYDRPIVVESGDNHQLIIMPLRRD